MAAEEAQIALDLSFHERNLRRDHPNSWVIHFTKDLRTWLAEESRSARQTLKTDHGQFRERNLHAHRRIMAIYCQEIDLLEQGAEDAASASDSLPADMYYCHAISAGTAIIAGARLVSLPYSTELPPTASDSLIAQRQHNTI